jgi:hypothetical protein
MAPMLEPMALTSGNAAPSSTVPLVGLRVLQLFPIPGNIYESARYYYDSAANLTKVPKGTLGQSLLLLQCTVIL